MVLLNFKWFFRFLSNLLKLFSLLIIFFSDFWLERGWSYLVKNAPKMRASLLPCRLRWLAPKPVCREWKGGDSSVSHGCPLICLTAPAVSRGSTYTFNSPSSAYLEFGHSVSWNSGQCKTFSMLVISIPPAQNKIIKFLHWKSSGIPKPHWIFDGFSFSAPM